MVIAEKPRPAMAPQVVPASGHRLIHGDSLVPSLLALESVDLVVTSPPHNVGKAYSGDESDDGVSYADYREFTYQWLRNCYEWTRPTGGPLARPLWPWSRCPRTDPRPAPPRRTGCTGRPTRQGRAQDGRCCAPG